MTDRHWMMISALFYGIAVCTALVQLTRRRQPPHSALFLLLLSGFFFQTAGLYLRGMEHHSCPTGNTFEVLQFIGWSTILLFLITGPVFRLSLIGTAAANIAVFISIISLLVPAWDHSRQERFGGDPWIEAHAAIALFSYGVFAMLAAISGMFLIQHYGLRRKKFAPVLKFLPSILDMEKVMGRLL